MGKGFICEHCHKQVSEEENIGTSHRNHCPFCLWSKHVDLKDSGDRKSLCNLLMKPIGLTFKREGNDKYGNLKQGEIMIVHECVGCGKISINRVAGDDLPETIISLIERSPEKDEAKRILEKENIRMLGKNDLLEIKKQLYGYSV